MNILDVNVLIPLYRADHELHEAASTWWRESSGSGEAFSVPDLVWVGFARMVTHRKMFPVPSSSDEAWAFARALMAQPTYLTWLGHPRTMEEFARLCDRSGARANLVTDAYIAACAQAYGGTIVTFDRDFRKFDDLRVLELTA
ncbi:TA system VapC family ribonuclease toxin [Nocardioides stalactiti]|uniref:TA system VapC family ribonuclease toxin n=1 Tax=Nocardioides stalactiti TaxID=2755356 RepID=UPI0016000E1E|nr:TA system VapC family ribonuclease toxin [Nocardioides stalactiti]